MTYREFIHQWDANAPKGVTTMLNTVDQGFQPEIIDTLIEQGLPFSSPFVHRAASLSWSREPSVRRKLRQDHLMVELIAAWEPQDDEQRHINISQALAPMKADTSAF